MQTLALGVRRMIEGIALDREPSHADFSAGCAANDRGHRPRSRALRLRFSAGARRMIDSVNPEPSNNLFLYSFCTLLPLGDSEYSKII